VAISCFENEDPKNCLILPPENKIKNEEQREKTFSDGKSLMICTTVQLS
jgi:hypothetical protein